MNHTYRLVWQQATQRYVPAPECAKSKSKSKTDKTRKALAPAVAILSAAHALPSGHHVVSGNASVSQAGSQMHIQQGSHKAIIDWASFNIGQDSAVTFAQPDTSAIALNRVTAGEASQIHGQLNANGQVWLVNPNGVVFGAGSQVDVGGLVASSMDISNADFESGNHTFSRNGATGSIINQGTITAKDGGSIALLAPTVRNDGILSAQLGSVAMAAGEQITLQTGDTGLLSVQVAPATLNTLVENRQLIVADGGQVIMTGKAADALAASVVSNSGAIAANSLQEKDGKILLLADMQHGETQVAGTLEAKFIDTSAATVSIDKDLKINTHGGQWLIDPVDITIDSSKASAIETALGTGDVTVSTSNGHTNPGEAAANSGTDAGDIHVNADISYTAHQLTLNADRDIHLKAQINVNDSGTLALNYGGTAGNSSATPAAGSTIRAHFGDSGGFKGQVNFANAGEDLLQINGTDYTVIKTAADLQNMQSKLSGKYALGGDVDASGFGNFVPVGNYDNSFTGSFDGLGHTISGLTIDHSGQDYVGLFGATSNAALRNVGLEGVVAQGQNIVGGLAGRLDDGSISQAYVTGTVSGTAASIGGLVGQQEGGSNISHAYATAAVSGNIRAGGLVGGQSGGSISHAYASGTVTGTGSTPSNIGGLVGEQSSGSISHAYASGAVSGDNHIGGLVGYQSTSGSHISYAYATGAVSGNSSIGGLVGRQPQGSIDHAYYATTDAAGNAINQSSNALGTGKTFAQLTDPDLYTGWDSSIWSLAQGAQAEGYEIALPSLIGVTRAEDVTRSTLFANGWGTEAAAYGIANWEQLSNTRLLLDKHYQLNNDLDSSTSGYAQHASTTANSGAGWQPIGNDSTPFTGSLDGQDHTISGLRILRPDQDNVGLFGETMTASVQHVGLIDAQVTGRDYVGSLVGFNGNSSRISHSYASGGVVQGHGDGVGGLAGANAFDSSISHSYASSHVQATNFSLWVGGLVGSNLDGSSISNSYATGAVTASSSWYVGGLVGENDGSTIEQSYATGLVKGGGYLGGLVGNSDDSSNYDNSGSNRDRVDNSYYATTDAAGNTIHNNGAKNKGWNGNAHGTAKTLNALMNPSLY
ncbi:MAG: filamentous hemagglutinin N-terminal domain-containing protein, partial [Comamonas sp.]|nr:filamentous hemagglutinin N-terminal domain-containing protein [Comamonas sp.]